ncbi:MAG: SdpI family protein [Balneola sp.]
MNLMESLKKEWFVWPILLAPFIVSFYLWDQLPEQVPTHFNIQGEADDWGPKWINAFMIPGIAVVTYLLLLVLPLIDPKRKISNTQKPIAAIRVFSSLFLVAIYAFVITASLGIEVNLTQYIYLAVGALFLILGNYMNSVKPNYFIGLRTPWTLESPEVWKKTHRLGSKIWMVGGLLLMAVPFLVPLEEIATGFTILILLLVGIPTVYSYIIFKKKESSRGEVS